LKTGLHVSLACSSVQNCSIKIHLFLYLKSIFRSVIFNKSALDAKGNIYSIGYTTSFGAVSADFALVKFYSNGTKAWNTTWGGSSEDWGNDIALDTAGIIYCIGYTTSFGAGAADFALIKFGYLPETAPGAIFGFELIGTMVILLVILVFRISKRTSKL
jgi:hypothetical protein